MSAMTTAAPTSPTPTAEVPDVFVPRLVAAAVLSSNGRRILALAREGRIRTRKAPGGRETYALRDVLGLLEA